METDLSQTLAQEMGIPIGANPMKPEDVVIHPSFTKMPPKCPVCSALLYPTQQDPQSGNLLFECLNGDYTNAGHYMAVWRRLSTDWGQRPGAERDGWQPPTFDGQRQQPHRKRKVKTRQTKVKRSRVRETMPSDG